jgi:hypothetical protein
MGAQGKLHGHRQQPERRKTILNNEAVSWRNIAIELIDPPRAGATSLCASVQSMVRWHRPFECWYPWKIQK